MGTSATDDADDVQDGTGSAAEHRMPGWVKGFVIAGVVVAVLVIVAVLLGGGRHGPQRHVPGSGGGQIETPGSHAPPPGGDHG